MLHCQYFHLSWPFWSWPSWSSSVKSARWCAKWLYLHCSAGTGKFALPHSTLVTFHPLPPYHSTVSQCLSAAQFQSHLQNSQHVILVAIEVVIQLRKHVLRSANQALQNLQRQFCWGVITLRENKTTSQHWPFWQSGENYAVTILVLQWASDRMIGFSDLQHSKPNTMGKDLFQALVPGTESFTKSFFYLIHFQISFEISFLQHTWVKTASLSSGSLKKNKKLQV